MLLTGRDPRGNDDEGVNGNPRRGGFLTCSKNVAIDFCCGEHVGERPPGDIASDE